MRAMMPPVVNSFPWRQYVLCVAPTLFLLLSLFAVFGGESGLRDHFYSFRARHPDATLYVTFLTDYAIVYMNLPFVVVLWRAIFKKNHRERRFVFSYTVALCMILLVVGLAKAGFGRARPFVGGGFEPWSWLDDYYSFPSGHTTEAFSAALTLASRRRQTSVSLLAGTAAAGVAFTRMYLGMHFMTDVLGGVCMGSLCGLLAWAILHRLEDSLPPAADASPSQDAVPE